VGSNDSAGRMSPNNLLVTTITDELRLATNFKSKVIGIAIKDRGAILPAGHTANAAYWYDDQSGNWITSTYYISQLPAWVNRFNKRRLTDSLLSFDWQPVDSSNKYAESTIDEKSYERKFPGEASSAFPHYLARLTTTQKDTAIRSVPAGNTFTLQFARAAIEGENLGAGNTTDFLAISCSSTDYIGHQFGPNSMENEDDYIRFDSELASFLRFLDMKYGSENYLVFLTADHGVAHVPGFLQENKVPGGFLNTAGIAYYLNANAMDAFHLKSNVIINSDNYQLTLDHDLLKSAKISREKMIEFLLPFLKMVPGIANEFDIEKVNECTLPEAQKKMFSNGYYGKRCGDIQLIFQPGWIDGDPTGTTHGLWNPYDAHIPLLWYGWNIKPGTSNREVYMTDISATLAALLHIQMPNGCIGHVIEGVVK
ncbi:MAG: alkaline phosphatase family protein, partial [Chitinophagales bacterium]